jgi:GGDEF domain-containing protein
MDEATMNSEQMVRATDIALYEAKESGKDGSRVSGHLSEFPAAELRT